MNTSNINYVNFKDKTFEINSKELFFEITADNETFEIIGHERWMIIVKNELNELFKIPKPHIKNYNNDINEIIIGENYYERIY